MPSIKKTAFVTSCVSAMAIATLACAQEAELEHTAAEEVDVYAEQTDTALDQDITTEDLVTETQGYESTAKVEIPTDAAASETEVTLTKEDTIALSVAKFSAADADGDGALTQDEFVAMTVSMSKTLEAELMAPPAEDILSSESMPEDVAIQAAEEAAATAEVTETATAQFAAIAEDENKVTQEKVVAAIVASFDKADTDDDNLIEGEELIKFAELTKKGAASEEL